MKLTKLLCCLVFASQLTAQNNGDTLRGEGKLSAAIIAYKKHFNSNKTNQRNTYNLACAYALTNQKDSAFYYLHIALKNDARLWVLADNDFSSLIDDERWLQIEQQQLSKFQTKNGPLQNPIYTKKLLRLLLKDQALDYQLDLAKRHYQKHGNIPHWYYPIARLKARIGKHNFQELELLIQQYGWPSYASVGKLAADAPLLIINHLEKEDMRIKYLPKIRKACIEKQGSCMEYAKIQDRILVNTNQPQLYGMQFRYNNKRQLEPFPIKDPTYVDERRLAIGLEPIKKYLQRKINFTWSIPQKSTQ